MPVAGETKWSTVKRFDSKESLMEELGIVEGALDWVSIAGVVATFAGILSAALSVAGLAVISAQIYYSQYRNELEEVLEEVEALPEGTSFTVQQKFKWHAGKRSWTPVNDLRVV